jgi:hypothetical protein
MFVLYVVILSIIVSYLFKGRLKYILKRPMKHIWLAASGLLIQVIIFNELFASRFNDTTTIILHGISYLLVILFVFINRKIPGIIPIGLGVLLNATVIFLNGGYMPASLASVEKACIGKQFEILKEGATTNNSQIITEDTMLPWLADIFYIPSWIPFSNVFSIGDVFIATGIFLYITRCMRPSDQ